VNRESEDLYRALKSGESREKVNKETNNLVKVLGVVGVHSYVNNFPNKIALRFALNKARRSKTKAGAAILHDHRYSKLGQKIDDYDAKVRRTAFEMANLHAREKPTYRIGKKGKQGFQKKLKLTRKVLEARMDKHNQSKKNALAQRSTYM
jgi:hypothetical protein